jgi:hypothetical protein
MQFLSSEKNFKFEKDTVIYFYSSNINFPISKLIFNVIDAVEIELNINITCADLFYFKNFHKRFNLTELPTIIVFKNGLETKRITGIPTVDNLRNIFINA